MAKMFFNRGRSSRDSRQIENHLISRLVAILTGNFGYKEERSILSGGHFTCSISNHLQQALQVKLGSKCYCDAVQLCQFISLHLQVRNEIRTTLFNINVLSHITHTPSKTTHYNRSDKTSIAYSYTRHISCYNTSDLTAERWD